MTEPVRRAGAFAALSTLSLAVPLVGPTTAAPLGAVALLFAVVIRDGPLFDLFAYPKDYDDGRLYGLVTFVLAAIALGFIATTTSMSIAVFVGTVLLVGWGTLGERLARRSTDRRLLHVAAFSAAGAGAAIVGQSLSVAFRDQSVGQSLPEIVFLAASGVLLAALLRDILFLYDLPIVMLAIGVLLWLLAELKPALGVVEITVALGITVAIGYASYALETASIAGMLTGILLGLLTIVLGGYDWFVVLIAFFAIGSLSTKYRYDEKVARGVAQDNDGARGSANVLGNAAVALTAVLGYAASDAGVLPGNPDLFLFAFAGSIATALSDTLSSEIGGVFDTPRLITTFESVAPGTDGGVTWQGTLAGVGGAAAVAVLAVGFFPEVDLLGGTIIVAAGVVGMVADSLLGATIEGNLFGNQTVNFLATLVGALVSALLLLVTLGGVFG